MVQPKINENSHWRSVKISDLASYERNSFVIGPFGSDLVQSDYRDSGVPVVFVRDIKRNRFQWISNVFLDIEKSEKLKAHSAKPGDIVITKMGLPPGIAAVYPYNLEQAIITADIIRLRPDSKKVESSFLCEILNSPNVQKQVYERTAGQTRPKLTLFDYKSIEVFIPALEEQKKIAQILSTWDKALTTTEQLLANSRSQKQALMQQLLTGKKRLGISEGSYEFKKTRYGVIPKDWEYLPVKDFCIQVTDKNTDSCDYPVLSCSKHDGFVDSLKYFNKKVFSDDTSGYRIIYRGCFGFPANHIEEGSIGLQNLYDAGIVSPIYVVFRTKPNKINNEYLYSVFKTDKYRQIFGAATNASVDRRGSLRWKEFSQIQVPVPLLEEQERIATVLTAADNEIELLEKKLEHLKNEKKALMQQLLTGKRRVKIDQSEVA